MHPNTVPGHGAFVISLDFELHWGVRDGWAAAGPYRANLMGARQAVPRMLSLFREFGVGATWATVGFLFARTRDELMRFSPALLPSYHDARLWPYGEALGEGEDDDPLHYAASLVERVAAEPRQEVATHTWSHFYCLEPGQTEAQFAADLRSATAIASARGIRLRSIVLPRNQHNPAYDGVLREAGITCFRGNQDANIYRATAGGGVRSSDRLLRLADTYLDVAGPSTTPWHLLRREDGLCNVPASRFLRPFSPRAKALEPVRLRRVQGALRHAARRGEVFHLWWHPHNFGTHLEENLAFLRRVLEEFDRLRQHEGMRSLTMAGVEDTVSGVQVAA